MNISEGSVIEFNPFMEGLSKEPILGTVLLVKGSSIELELSYYGVHMKNIILSVEELENAIR